MTSVTRKRDGRWKVSWEAQGKAELIAVTNFEKETKAIIHECEMAILEDQFEGWMTQQKAVRYEPKLRKWYVSASLYGKKYYLGYMGAYSKCKMLYDEIVEFTHIHHASEFHEVYGHLMEQYRAERLILKVRSGQIFFVTASGRIEAVLVEKKAKYPLGQIFPDETKELQERVIRKLKKGMYAFEQWHREQFFRQRLESNLFTLIGEQFTDRTVSDFAVKCMDNTVAKELKNNTWLIVSGKNQARLKLHFNRVGVIMLSEIEYIEQD